MLSKIALPPIALQAFLLAVAGVLEARLAWFMPEDHVPMRDEGIEVLPFLILGLVGFIVFIPLHWFILWMADKWRVPSGRLYLIATILVGLLWVLSSTWGLALSVIFAPCMALMGLADLAVNAWHRRRELAEQRASEAFVLSRKQKLVHPSRP